MMTMTMMMMMIMMMIMTTTTMTTTYCYAIIAGNTNDTSLLLRVQTLNVTSPLYIPGQVTIVELEATLSGPLPAGALIHFNILSNSSFGPDLPRQLPCFQNHEGSW